MLLAFTLENFRSFRDAATLSMVASSDKTLPDNIADVPVSGLRGGLRTAAIYGANASGKSNLLRGLFAMRDVVLTSATMQPGQNFTVRPFLLDPAMRAQPTTFEATFVADGTRYQYGFTLSPQRVIDEWLLVFHKAKPRRWFTRTEQDYKFSDHLIGQRRLWQEATRENALFLSVAAQLNSTSLRPVFAWFARMLVPAEHDGQPWLGTLQLIEQHPTDPTVRDLLAEADTGIGSVTLVHAFDSNGPAAEPLVAVFEHETAAGRAVFDLADESDGTQRLFALAGPVREALRDGRLLVVDELDRSLHPLLVRKVVAMFQDPAINPHGAQLVFTTHDAALLGAGLLRRDQIWLVEKDAGQASRLVPLSDFAPRKDEAIERGYLSGRYGGIPILG